MARTKRIARKGGAGRADIKRILQASDQANDEAETGDGIGAEIEAAAGVVVIDEANESSNPKKRKRKAASDDHTQDDKDDHLHDLDEEVQGPTLAADGAEDGDGAAEGRKRKRKRNRKKKAEDQDDEEDQTQLGAGEAGNVPASEGAEQYTNECTVYVEGISYNATEDDLRNFFENSGEISSVRFPRYQDSGKPRGYAHVVFTNKEAAETALTRSGEYLLDRYVNVARPMMPRAFAPGTAGKPPPGCKTIFVKNLPYTATEESVKKAMMICGKISSIRLAVWNHTGKLKGFGYVEYMREDSAQIAVKKSGTIMIDGRPIICDYETGAPKSSYRTPDGKPWKKSNKPK